MSADTGEKLVSMINQIARNITYERDQAVMIANHINAFWSPRMKTIFFNQIAAHGPESLDPMAKAAHGILVGRGSGPSPGAGNDAA